MENKLKNNLITIISIVLIAILGLVSVVVVINAITKDYATTNSNDKSIGIDKKTFESIAKPNNYDSNISLDEGFGRENPFASYK